MTGPYDIILADPPWHFSANSAAKPGKGARAHYPTMRTPEICAMPVRDWSARSALLLLWATAPMLPDALEVVRAWGFRYKSHVVWDKGKMGTGYWSRSRHEPLLIATRGRFPCPRPLFPVSIIEAPRREHSRKPDEVQDMVEARLPGRSMLEIFARQTRPGWAVWGNDTGRFPARNPEGETT